MIHGIMIDLTHTISKDWLNTAETSRINQFEMIRTRLAEDLARRITIKPDFFTWLDNDKDYPFKQLQARAFVLTPAEFNHLVKTIQDHILYTKEPIITGGVYL